MIGHQRGVKVGGEIGKRGKETKKNVLSKVKKKLRG